MPGRGAPRRSARTRRAKAPYTGEPSGTLQAANERRSPHKRAQSSSADLDVNVDVVSTDEVLTTAEENVNNQSITPNELDNSSSQTMLLAMKELTESQITQGQSLAQLIKVTNNLVTVMQKKNKSAEGIELPQSTSQLGPETNTINMVQHSSGQSVPGPSSSDEMMLQQFSSQSGSSAISSNTLLNPKVVEKIKRKEYVKFKTLLDRTEESDSEDSDLEEEGEEIEKYASGGVVKYRKRKRTGGKMAWSEWLRCWHQYAKIYAKHHSNIANVTEKLDEHLEVVQDIKDNHKRWSFYDRRVRKFLGQNPQEEFGGIQKFQQLWMKAMIQPERTGANPGKKFKNSSMPFNERNMPNGYCFKFHRPDAFCKKANDACRYDHTCFKCHKGVHPAFRCNKFAGASRSGNSNFRGKPKKFGAPSSQPGQKQK